MSKLSPARRAQLYTYLANTPINNRPSEKAIAKLYGISRSRIGQISKELGVAPKPGIGAEVKSQIPKLYNELKRMSLVAQKLNISRSVVQKELKRQGIVPFYGGVGAPNRFRKHEDNFHNLSEAELGYICGLWASDGNLNKNNTRVTLGLQEDDQNTIKYISEALATPPMPIDIRGPGTKGKKSMHYTYACLPGFYQYCLDMGITPAKSLTLDVNLEGKSEEFLWHFLRGVIDGDGTVYFKAGRGLMGTCISIFSASKAFIDTLERLFGGYKTKEPNYWMLSFTGNYAQQLAKKLPKEGFTMERKSKKLVLIENTPQLCRPSVRLTGELWHYDKPLNALTDREAVAYEAYLRLGNINETARITGFPRTSLQRTIEKVNKGLLIHWKPESTVQ